MKDIQTFTYFKKDYQTDFVNLVSAEKVAFDEKSGLMKEMRNTVHQFDDSELEKLTHWWKK